MAKGGSTLIDMLVPAVFLVANNQTKKSKKSKGKKQKNTKKRRTNKRSFRKRK
jgi:hypothetical protein